MGENRRKVLQENKRKQIMRFFKEQEAMEAARRLKKLERNHRENILRSIDEKNHKIEQLRKEKEKAMEERQKLEIFLKREKERALESLNISQNLKSETKVKNHSFFSEKTSNKNAVNSYEQKNFELKDAKNNEKNEENELLLQILNPQKKNKKKKKNGDVDEFFNKNYLRSIEDVKKVTRKNINEILDKKNEDLMVAGNEILDLIKFIIFFAFIIFSNNF